MGTIVNFPAKRRPDPLDYPNEGGLPCDCEPRDAVVIALPIPARQHATLFDMCFHFFMLSCAIAYLCYRH